MLRIAFAGLSLCLVACGGGGGNGGSSNSLRLSFTQNPLTVSVYEWDVPRNESEPELRIPVSARVSGTTSASTVYVLIDDQSSVFKPGSRDVSQTGTDTYSIDLPTIANLSIGRHDGNLHVRVCADPGCAQLLTSATLPYRITVSANPSLTVSASAPLVGSALAAGNNDPSVVGFHLPTLSFKGVSQLPAQFRSPIYIRSVDSAGRVAVRPWTNSEEWAYLPAVTGDNTFQLDFMVSVLPEIGRYDGSMALQVCRDPDCRYRFSGDSALSYQLSVIDSKLTDLAPVADVPEWRSEYGNPARTSSVPITVDAEAFSPRWKSAAARSTSYDYTDDVVTAGGHVFVSRRSISGFYSAELFAIDEADGATAWQKNFPAELISPLLTANGNIYFETTAHNESAVLRAHDSNSGAELFSKQTQSSSSNSPILSLGDDLLIAELIQNESGGSQKLFSRYDGGNGEPLNQPACLRTRELQAVNSGGFNMNSRAATSADKAYLQMSSGLEVVDFGEAQSCTTLSYGDLWYSATTGVLGAVGRLLYVRSSCSSDVLVSVSTESLDSWSAEMSNCSARNVAVANGVVYSIGAGTFQARDEVTGSLRWQTDLAETFQINGGSVLITNNVAFVFAERVFAIDLSTHKVVWTLSPLSLPPAGWALSPSGILYLLNRPGIPARDGWLLVAVNLR